MNKVDVLLSVYRPDLRYLEAQLRSLNEQTYKNMEVLIYDDCPEEPCDPDIFRKCLTDKKYRILPCGKKNLGYVKAFEYLVRSSEGDYAAFCDQDDVWVNDKIEKCVRRIKKDGALLVATDRKLIDGEGRVYCESVCHMQRRGYSFPYTSETIAIRNFFDTFAPGMCLMADGSFVRNTIPFSEYTGHDKWIIACACACGKISFVDEPLSLYRRYGKNVSGIMSGIRTKADYREQRVLPHLKLIEEFEKRYPQYDGTRQAYVFARDRAEGNVPGIFRGRKIAPQLAYFECILALLPDFAAEELIRFLKRRA